MGGTRLVTRRTVISAVLYLAGGVGAAFAGLNQLAIVCDGRVVNADGTFTSGRRVECDEKAIGCTFTVIDINNDGIYESLTNMCVFKNP